MKITVGDRIFELSNIEINKEPYSILSCLNSGRWNDNKIDRDADLFSYIYDYLKGIPFNIDEETRNRLYEEADFYNLEHLRFILGYHKIDCPNPEGIAVSKTGDIFVTSNNHIKKFDMYGNFITKIRGFKKPIRLTIKDDILFVSDFDDSCIKLYKDYFLTEIKTKKNPESIYVDDKIYVSYNSNIVSMFGLDGNFIKDISFGSRIIHDIKIYKDMFLISDNHIYFYDIESNSIKEILGRYDSNCIYVDGDIILIADCENNQIIAYKDKIIKTYGNFKYPECVCVNPITNMVLVSDKEGIHMFPKFY